MKGIELINLIAPEHSRNSCSDVNVSNGFFIEENDTISEEYYPRCRRCALLDIENGRVKLTDKNKGLIPRQI